MEKKLNSDHAEKINRMICFLETFRAPKPSRSFDSEWNLVLIWGWSLNTEELKLSHISLLSTYFRVCPHIGLSINKIHFVLQWRQSYGFLHFSVNLNQLSIAISLKNCIFKHPFLPLNHFQAHFHCR